MHGIGVAHANLDGLKDNGFGDMECEVDRKGVK